MPLLLHCIKPQHMAMPWADTKHHGPLCPSSLYAWIPWQHPAWKGYVHPYMPGIYAVIMLISLLSFGRHGLCHFCYSCYFCHCCYVCSPRNCCHPNAYLSILEYFRLAWHFYKCMPITMPDAPDIYANFMLFLLCIPSKQAAIYSPDIGEVLQTAQPFIPLRPICCLGILIL